MRPAIAAHLEHAKTESGDLGQDKSWAYVAKKPGEIAYICRLHPVMHGVLVVKQAAGMAAPAACSPGMDVRDQVTELVPHLRRYAKALGTGEISSDELVRATLERAQGQLDRYSPEVNLRVWLFGLMHHSYIAQLRGAEAAAALEPNHELNTEAPADGKTLSLRDFERAIASLPPSHREIFLLVTLEDMSYQDVARALDIPIGTVMSRLSRAREKLRLLLMSQAGLRMVK